MEWPPAFQTYCKNSSDYGSFLLASYFIEKNMYQMTAESPADEKIYYVYNIALLVGSQQNRARIVTSNCFYQAGSWNTQMVP